LFSVFADVVISIIPAPLRLLEPKSRSLSAVIRHRLLLGQLRVEIQSADVADGAPKGVDIGSFKELADIPAFLKHVTSQAREVEGVLAREDFH